MARELRRLLIPPDRLQPLGPDRIEPAGTEPAGTLVQLEPAEAHYVARVLRFRCGDALAVIDGAGSLWSAILEQPAQLRLQQPLAQPLQRAARGGLWRQGSPGAGLGPQVGEGAGGWARC